MDQHSTNPVSEHADISHDENAATSPPVILIDSDSEPEPTYSSGHCSDFTDGDHDDDDDDNDDDDIDRLQLSPPMAVSDFTDTDQEQDDRSINPRFGGYRPPTPPIPRGADEYNPIYISSSTESETDDE